MSISDYFLAVLGRCEFTDTDLTAVATHRSEVERCLKGALNVSKIEPIGSHARGSSIRQTSDLDLLAVLRNTEWLRAGARINSSTVLANVREVLRGRFPTTAIGRDGQAIVVEFYDKKSIDVVPSGWIGTRPDNWPLYIIPDGTGGWRETAPDSHGRYILDADVKSGGKLKNVARIFKYWRQSRATQVPISAFHVELLLAAEGTCSVGRSYASCLTAAFVALNRRECKALRDPIGVSGLIAACSTEPKRANALTSIQASAERAVAALTAEERGDTREAWRLWNIIFNDQFPR